MTPQWIDTSHGSIHHKPIHGSHHVQATAGECSTAPAVPRRPASPRGRVSARPRAAAWTFPRHLGRGSLNGGPGGMAEMFLAILRRNELTLVNVSNTRNSKDQHINTMFILGQQLAISAGPCSIAMFVDQRVSETLWKWWYSLEKRGTLRPESHGQFDDLLPIQMWLSMANRWIAGGHTFWIMEQVWLLTT